MNKTSIQWTSRDDGTPGLSANPLKYRRKSDGKVVWACVKKSPGCAHCYSEKIALHYDRGKLFNATNMEELEPFLDEAELGKMLTAKRVGGVQVSGSRCFVGDMTDVFGEWVPDELLDRLFAVFALRADVTWQVLTKRAERMQAYFDGWVIANPPEVAHRTATACGRMGIHFGVAAETFHQFANLPFPNIWMGVSCEDQQRAVERVPHLLRTPAAIRFVSYEPALGPVDFTYPPSLFPDGPQMCCNGQECGCRGLPVDPPPWLWPKGEGIDWVIVGGESGPGARPCRVAWIRSAVEQCRAFGVACFVKQFGSKPLCEFGGIDVGTNGFDAVDFIDAGNGMCRPMLLDSKGGTMDEWPEDLRVRQFPQPNGATP
jgi:protein gp37